MSPTAALPTTEIALMGGPSAAPGGVGQGGGALHVVSAGGITFDPGAPAAAVPSIPDAPASAMAIGSADLSSDVSAAGSIVVSGTVSSRGPDAIRRITAAGDVYIAGTLRAADLGGSRQGFDIEAPGHTIFVAGAVDASGAGGQAGGAVTLHADAIVIAGTVDVSGGDASAGGGAAGTVSLVAAADVAAGGTIRARGGAVTGTAAGSKGGDGGALTIDCAGALTWTATLDGRGGTAASAHPSGTVTGGAAGTFTVGGTTPPKSVVVTVPAVVAGGSGAAAGGDGGSIELDAQGGDLVLAAGLDASGGDSATKPGAGGTIQGYPGPKDDSANLDVSAQILANGGSVPTGGGGAVNGGAGGLIKLLQRSMNGNATTEPAAGLRANGGKSGGTGTAGPGGMIYLFTKHGSVTVHGQLEARGGDAPEAGGTGGGGGFVYVFSGDGHDRMSGTLIISPDGVIDASGGSGTTGGSARNNGAGGVNLWPSVQTDELDVEQIAVLINSDGVHGADRGWIDNQGKIIARGGATNGAGGDVVYHGRRQDGNETPLSGDVENMGDGTGLRGDFSGE
jgi:hypothetical protein